ncbi:hypothetical protein NX059_006129 [Plenodomus lindquistii]|nr:hypothetical protein NX059_006129 [Plenodomus lindquistii]
MLSSVGAFTLFQSGSATPLWPAVVMPDDIAPQEFLNTRPHAYVHLILLLGQDLKFRWALTSELHDYDPSLPFTDAETVRNIPGLWEAYQMAGDAIEGGLGLDHWRSRVRTEMRGPSSDSITLYAESDLGTNDDFFDDEDLQRALEQSRLEFENANRRPFLTPSMSPPPSSRRADKEVIIVDSDDESDDDLICYPPSRVADRNFSNNSRRPDCTIGSSKMPVRDTPFQAFSQEQPCASSSTNLINVDESAASASRPNQFLVQRTFADGLNLKRLGQRVAPRSDVISGRLETSKEYVRAHVGTQRDEFRLRKDDIFDRPYFRDSNSGVMHFTLEDDGIYELKHPSLLDINPDDFALIAQYLESGQLGFVNPQGAEQHDVAFSQIVAAWTVAQTLGMTDLLEHLVEKLGRLALWDMMHVIFLASTVYSSPGVPLPAEEMMKDKLAGNIAENYWIYVEDDHLSREFIQRLKDLPELDRDVSAKRKALLDDRLTEES